jgi:hypothetical protein
MKKINLLITGPLRPNISYINYLITQFTNLIEYDIQIFLCCWKNNNIEYNLIKGVDHLLIEEEPCDEIIFKNITSRTKQQNNIYPNIEHWTPRIYKMFFGIKKLTEYIDINKLIIDDDIVLRIRTDLFIESCNKIQFNNLINNLINDSNNNIYNRIRKHHCDWFTISSYNNFKKLWYIENDIIYNNIIKHLFNAEDIIRYKSNLHKINVINIRNIINLGICREYNDKDKDNTKIQFYG